jgi:hypothetical protein
MEYFKDNNLEQAVVMPLHLIDHSGISMSASDFGDPWDSGQVGWIYAHKPEIRKWFMKKQVTKQLIEKTRECLKIEVDEYDHYLTGGYWGYVIKKDGEEVDSCWGFYEDIHKTLKSELPSQYHTLIDELEDA